MPALSGYSSALPTDVLLGSGVLYIDGTTAYGATQGEPTVSIPHEYESLPYDGSLGIPMVGLIRRVWRDVFIEGTFVELNATKALELEPGGATATASSVTTITPGDYGEFLASGAFKENVRLVFRRGGGGIVLVEFNWGLLKVDSIAGASTGNGTVKLRFDAVQAAGSAPGAPPYTIKLAADIATVVTPDP